MLNKSRLKVSSVSVQKIYKQYTKNPLSQQKISLHTTNRLHDKQKHYVHLGLWDNYKVTLEEYLTILFLAMSSLLTIGWMIDFVFMKAFGYSKTHHHHVPFLQFPRSLALVVHSARLCPVIKCTAPTSPRTPGHRNMTRKCKHLISILTPPPLIWVCFYLSPYT